MILNDNRELDISISFFLGIQSLMVGGLIFGSIMYPGFIPFWVSLGVTGFVGNLIWAKASVIRYVSKLTTYAANNAIKIFVKDGFIGTQNQDWNRVKRAFTNIGEYASGIEINLGKEENKAKN